MSIDFDFFDVLVLHEKHGDRMYIVDTIEERNRIAEAIVLERWEEGWYDEMNDPDVAEIALNGDSFSPGQAWSILRSHDGYEYEGVEMQRISRYPK